MISAFGVEHGEIAKGISTAPYHIRRGLKAVKTAAKKPEVKGSAAAGAGGFGVGVASIEAGRRVQNRRKGMNIGFGQAYKHPYKSKKQWNGN